MAGYLDYDYFAVAAASTADTITFYKGTSSGALVGTTTIIYTDTSKSLIAKVFVT